MDVPSCLYVVTTIMNSCVIKKNSLVILFVNVTFQKYMRYMYCLMHHCLSCISHICVKLALLKWHLVQIILFILLWCFWYIDGICRSQMLFRYFSEWWSWVHGCVFEYALREHGCRQGTKQQYSDLTLTQWFIHCIWYRRLDSSVIWLWPFYSLGQNWVKQQ